MKYTRVGKEVLCDGEHFADACDTEAAEIIVDALNMLMEFAAHVTEQPK